jgi:putative membrane protein insertion efficiency factor
MRRGWKRVLLGLLALTVYLTAESALPASAQPTARLGLALIHGYQATGSKLMETGGVQCRYRPTCSHYADDAIAHYGFVSGSVRAMGRVWRCSPWGGSGYDPAVEEHSAAFVDSQQETPEQRKSREDAEKKAAEDFRKASENFSKELNKLEKNAPEEAGRAAGACLGGCLGALITVGIHIVIMVVALIYVWKDSKARGDPNQILWMILVFIFSWVGAIVYIVARPKGDLSPCPLCHQQRLATLAVCPHCKNAGATPPAAPPPAEPPKAIT